MAHKPRLNKIIDLLEQDKPVYGTFVNSGMIDDLNYVSDAGYDCVVIENEHVGMDFNNLRLSLQALLDRGQIAKAGNLQANPTPIVRVSPNSKEVGLNQWVLKQTLDYGVYGLIVPRMESVDAAKAAVAACRYVQKRGVADETPEGERGWSPGVAARYWGLSTQDYYNVADLWPLDPDGEMLLIPIVESARGVKAVDDILREVKGISVAWAGPGDMSVSMGIGPNYGAPEVEEGLQRVLRSCKRHGVPCAIGANSPEELDKRLEQGFRVFFTSPHRSTPALTHGKKLAGR